MAKPTIKSIMQPDGSLKCSRCGGTEFVTRHSAGRKLAVGVAVLVASANEVHCVACGAKYARGWDYEAANMPNPQRQAIFENALAYLENEGWKVIRRGDEEAEVESTGPGRRKRWLVRVDHGRAVGLGKFKTHVIPVDATPAATPTAAPSGFAGANTVVPPDETAAITELEKLADLHTRGILSDEEFAAAKARLLGTE